MTLSPQRLDMVAHDSDDRKVKAGSQPSAIQRLAGLANRKTEALRVRS